jgi:hypothetical protein
MTLHRWRARVAVAVLGIAAFVILPSSALAQSALVLYDDFNGKVIDPDRWTGQDFDTSARDRRETVRETTGNALRLASRLYSNPNLETTRNGGSMIRFLDPSSVNAIRAQLRVMDVEANACDPGGSPAIARGQMSGVFFNTGAGAAPSNQTGDVRAGLTIRRTSSSLDPPQVLEVIAFVNECTNAACTTTSSQSTRLGSVELKEKVNVALEWDKVNSQFAFQLRDDGPVAISYSAPLLKAPIAGEKTFFVTHTAPGCGGGLRSDAYMDLRVDNVFVNAALP